MNRQKSHCKICGLWKETPSHRMNQEPLEERIRELEAELADVRTYGAAARYKARAEKAEARVAELEKAIEWAKAKGFIQVGSVIADRLLGVKPLRKGLGEREAD